MPKLDGTGPRGTGSMTGRGLGKCRTGIRSGRTEGIQSNVQVPEGAVQMGDPEDQLIKQTPFYGAGRGGMPCGCGNGRRFGGNQYCRRG